MNELYVIKNIYGAFIVLHSGSKELNICMTDLKPEYQYTGLQVLAIKKKFRDEWLKDEFEVYKITTNLSRVYC